MNTTKLPDTLSDLILLACDDVERLPKGYRLSYDVWAKKHKKTCYVCLAGAVLVNTCSATIKKDTFKIEIEDKRANLKMLAIERAREGKFLQAYNLTQEDNEAVNTEWRFSIMDNTTALRLGLIGSQYTRDVPKKERYFTNAKPKDLTNLLAALRKAASSLKEFDL